MRQLDWLQDTLIALPPLLWVIFGVGLPVALIVLPRHDWRDKAMVACCALAFGPALLTAWMFVLGTLGMNDDPNAGATLNPMQTFIGDHVGGTALMTPANILLGTLVMALLGWALVWRKNNATTPDESPRNPLHLDEKVLIAFIIAATAARWVISSYLLFGAWDELWVYGYQGKIYTLLGYIPADIGYYPQFLPLQYAYTQILAGDISDHTARAVIPFIQIGSIFAVYVLGSRLFTRRTGIFAAALWALYPHFGYWTRIGDLETPLAFGFTGTAAFFLMAWTTYRDDPFYRRRYALIAGLFFGIAMWTKPTAGAFIWGAVLVAAVQVAMMLLRLTPPPDPLPVHREGEKADSPSADSEDSDVLSHHITPSPFAGVDTQLSQGGGIADENAQQIPSLYTGRVRVGLARLEVAFITGLACMPLGALWYMRNILIGHDPIVFPPSVWLTRASRSGVEFGWVLLALMLLLAFLYLTRRQRPDVRWIVPGVALIAAGVLPSIIDPHRMIWWEWALFSAGWALMGIGLWRYGRSHLSAERWREVETLVWAGLIALPYFITWFYSYSYHYRLSFAIVPLLILPSAWILSRWFSVERVGGWRLPLRTVYWLVLIAVALPGAAIAIYDESTGWDWLFQGNDVSSQEGAAIIRTVRTLEQYIATHDEPPVIVAPGAQRLPFYFPTLDIRTAEAIRDYDRLDGVTHFIDGADAIVVYTGDGQVAPFQNQLLAGLRRDRLATQVAVHIDTTFFYEIFELHLENRFEIPEVAVPAEGVMIGEFARLVGYTLSESTLSHTQDITLELVWESLAQAPSDYTIFVHLIDPQQGVDNVLTGWDGPVGRWERGYYSTLFWESGEYIIDTRTIRLPDDSLPAGEYRLRIGLYDTTGRVPITVGDDVDDGYVLDAVLTIE